MRVDLAGSGSNSDKKEFTGYVHEALQEEIKRSYRSIPVAALWRILQSLEDRCLGGVSLVDSV